MHPTAITLHMDRGPITSHPPPVVHHGLSLQRLALRPEHPELLLGPASHPHPTPNSAPHCHNPAHGDRSHPTPHQLFTLYCRCSVSYCDQSTRSCCSAPWAIHTQHQILHPTAITLHVGRGPILPPTGCSPCTVAAHLVLQSQHPEFLLSPVSHPYPILHPTAITLHMERGPILPPPPPPNGCSPCTVAAVSRTVTGAPGALVQRREPSGCCWPSARPRCPAPAEACLADPASPSPVACWPTAGSELRWPPGSTHEALCAALQSMRLSIPAKGVNVLLPLSVFGPGLVCAWQLTWGVCVCVCAAGCRHVLACLVCECMWWMVQNTAFNTSGNKITKWDHTYECAEINSPHRSMCWNDVYTLLMEGLKRHALGHNLYSCNKISPRTFPPHKLKTKWSNYSHQCHMWRPSIATPALGQFMALSRCWKQNEAAIPIMATWEDLPWPHQRWVGCWPFPGVAATPPPWFPSRRCSYSAQLPVTNHLLLFPFPTPWLAGSWLPPPGWRPAGEVCWNPSSGLWPAAPGIPLWTRPPFGASGRRLSLPSAWPCLRWGSGPGSPAPLSLAAALRRPGFCARLTPGASEKWIKQLIMWAKWTRKVKEKAREKTK